MIVYLQLFWSVVLC